MKRVGIIALAFIYNAILASGISSADIHNHLRKFVGDETKLLFQGESYYQTIYVTKRDNVIELRSAALGAIVSSMDVTQPYKHILEYTANMIMGLAYIDSPKKALMIGLGGATVPKYLQKYYPDLEITNVELDDVVVRVAKDFFNFVETPTNKSVVMDGRRFLTRSSQQYDLIFLDAYYGGYIPFHLLTAEFLQIVKDHLTENGVVVSNTWSSQKLYRSESATYASVFKYFDSYLGATSGNRIVIAIRSGRRFTFKELFRRMGAIQQKRQFYEINLPEMFEKTYDHDLSWPVETQILTDDHAPVNLLVDPIKR